MLWGITHGEILENMLRLMRFGVYFERILKIKGLFSYRNNYSIVTRIYALGAWGHMLPEKIMKIYGAVWCIFDQIVSCKIP